MHPKYIFYFLFIAKNEIQIYAIPEEIRSFKVGRLEIEIRSSKVEPTNVVKGWESQKL